MKLRVLGRAVLAASLLLGASACGKRHRGPPPPPFQRIVVATLPFDNATPSVDAPKILRAQLHPRVSRKGYLLQIAGETDAKLNEMGIQLGGQLKGVDPKELRAKLGADYAIWGTVKEASSLITGVYNKRTVAAEVIVTDLRTGEVIWKDEQKFTASEMHQSKYGIQVLAGAVEGMVKSDMQKEHAQLAEMLANRLPWCPREAPPPPPAAPAPAAPAPAPK